MLYDNQTEFERIKRAGRGTFRTERGEDYVIIAHCHTSEYIGNAVVIRETRWYVQVHFDGDLIARGEFANRDLSWQVLETFVAGTIAEHARQTAPAAR